MNNSIIAWTGGKKLLRKHIIQLIPEHRLYCEVFGGAGWVLFGKSTGQESKYTEVYNDINSELVNFWKYIKYHPEAFHNEISKQLVSRELFDYYKHYEPRTELERAVKFYYNLTCSYGSQSLSFTIKRGKKYLSLRNEETVLKASERLKNVIIEKMDFAKLINSYDSLETFFYIDPPYYGKEHLYEREDASSFAGHEALASLLKSIKGKFILSYNDHETIKQLYNGFKIDVVEAPYSLGGKKQLCPELLIRNY